MRTTPRRSRAESAACTSSLLDDGLQCRQESLDIRAIVIQMRRDADAAAANTHINARVRQRLRDPLAVQRGHADTDQMSDALPLAERLAAELARPALQHACERRERALNALDAPSQNLLERRGRHRHTGEMRAFSHVEAARAGAQLVGVVDELREVLGSR